MEIGKFINKLRSENGIRQKDLAKRLGITPKHLGELERGLWSPKIDFLNKLLGCFDMEVVIVKKEPKTVSKSDIDSIESQIEALLLKLIGHQITYSDCSDQLNTLFRRLPDMDNLRATRQRLNLTLRDVEEATGISNAYLSQLERGVIDNPSMKKIQQLSDFYLSRSKKY